MKQIYLFLGVEEIIIKNKIDKVIKDYNGDSYNTTTYDLDEVNVSEAVTDAITMPFISDHKIIILRNPTFLTKDKTEIAHNVSSFINYINNPLETTVLIIDATSKTLDQKKDVVKKLLKIAEVVETKKLSADEEEAWLFRQFQLEGIEIRQDAIKTFFSRVGHNLVRAKNEVQKLLNYATGKKLITSKDIMEVVSKEMEQEAYVLSNAILEKNKEKIIVTFQDLIKSGKDATQLLAMISRSMTENLLVGRLVEASFNQTDIANFMEVSPGRAYYMIKNAKVFQVAIIEERISQLADLDFKIKTGQIEGMAGLELFLFAL